MIQRIEFFRKSTLWVLQVADYESDVRFLKFKMTDIIWRTQILEQTFTSMDIVILWFFRHDDYEFSITFWKVMIIFE